MSKAKRSVVLRKVPFTKCLDCIFHSVENHGCIIEIDAEHEPFACVVGDNHFMWVVIKPKAMEFN